MERQIVSVELLSSVFQVISLKVNAESKDVNALWP